MNLAEIWENIKNKKFIIIGETVKNIGVGLLVNGLYGISDSHIELYNIIDVIIGVFMIVSGIILENFEKDEK